jgi:hypothetical protein
MASGAVKDGPGFIETRPREQQPLDTVVARVTGSSVVSSPIGIGPKGKSRFPGRPISTNGTSP